MTSFKLVTVFDWYDSSRSTRIRCEQNTSGDYFCSKRQKRDAIRRASVMSGSCLRSADGDIYVLDDDRRVVDWIERS